MNYGFGYARYSSHLQDEKSIEQQKMELEEYAKKNNIIIKKYYIDEAKSATKNDRDGFQNMITDACKDNSIKYVLVWKTDRFARNTQDSLYYRNKLLKNGTKLISITQPIDDTTPEGRLMSTMLAGMDEYYSQNLASNVRRAQKLKAKNYEFNGGIAPLGYDIVDKHYVINEKEAKIVKQIFSLYLNGHGLLEIADMLNKRGYTTKKNKPFGKNSLYDILKNEKYTGTYIYNKAYKHNSHIVREDAIIYEDVLPVIIRKEDFKKVNDKRTSYRKSSGSFSSKKVYLLSGLIVCGKCGGNYFGKTSKSRGFENGYYTCTNRNKLGKCTSPNIKQEQLENTVIDLLKDKLLNSNDIEEFAKKVNEEYKNIYKDSFSEIETISKEIEQKNTEIANLTIALSQLPTSKAIVERLEQLEDIKSMLEEQLILNKTINKIPEIDASTVKKLLKEDVNQLSKSVESKEILKKWIKKIEVNDKYITIYFDLGSQSEPCMVARDRTIIRYRLDIKSFIPKTQRA